MINTQSLDTAPQALSALLHAFNDTVPFIILRNYEDLPERWGNDVDILIRPADMAAAHKITLSTLRSSPHFAKSRELRRLNFWSIILPCSDRELQVDYCTKLTKAWITYANTEVIFAARKQWNPLFCTPDPLHELLLIAAKELFSYGYIRERYHEKLAGHNLEESFVAARLIFGETLTEAGCHLIAKALSDPTQKGWPNVRASVLLRPLRMAKWACLRRNDWRSINSIFEDKT